MLILVPKMLLKHIAGPATDVPLLIRERYWKWEAGRLDRISGSLMIAVARPFSSLLTWTSCHFIWPFSLWQGSRWGWHVILYIWHSLLSRLIKLNNLK
jgi:hypothetical protein